jgi:glycosyltransferase involved in cell wall biosynthesis
MKKVLHLLSGGGAGGIEVLCEQIGLRGEYQHEFCFLFSGGVIADRMKENGITTYDLSGEGFFGKRRELLQIFKEGNYDAVVVHHEGVKIYLLYEALINRADRLKLLDVTFIKYLHMALGDDYFSGNVVENLIHRHLLKKTMLDSDHVVAVSEFVKESYADDLGIDNEVISVIYNGIEVSDVKSRNSVDGSRLLYVGRLVPEKGVDVLLKAIKLLERQGIIVEADIIGDGDARGDLEKLAREQEISERVIFHGIVMEKDSFFNKDGIFVCPSICPEAFGISILEAMSNGLICVASRVGGIPEILEEDRQGILFEAGSPEALTEAIIDAQKRCVGDAYESYREAAISRAAAFDISRSVAGLESLIGE